MVKGARIRNSVRKCQTAFTLIELTIVVFIIGIMAAVAMPHYLDSLARFRVRAAAKRISADLAVARRQAKILGTTQSVQFTVGSNGYALPGISDVDHPALGYVVNLSKTGYPVTLISVNFAGNDSVIFDMYGRPDNGGSVVVTAGAYQQTITVNATTGRVVVQ